MNENENNLDSLRRLLAFKKRETPPPGYFDNFSTQVVNRIRAGGSHGRTKAREEFFSEAPWLLKFLQIFEARPAFASAFAGALCLVLVLGIVFAEQPDGSTPQLLVPQMAESSSPLAQVSTTALSQPSDSMILASENTNPASSLQPVASYFGQQNPFFQQVGFCVPGN
ncbi:MAG TPA: hypothetical protein VIK35_02470 [Verrucomicrobiae bacterium]